MRKILVLALVVLAAIGFFKLSSKDQQQVLDTGQNAAEAAGRVVAGGYHALFDQAEKLNEDSPEAKLKATKADLEDAKNKAEAKGDSKTTIDRLKDQIARIQAALDVQSIKKDLDDKVATASKTKENAEKNVDDVKKNLSALDAGYQALQTKLDEAKKAYADAEKRFNRAN